MAVRAAIGDESPETGSKLAQGQGTGTYSAETEELEEGIETGRSSQTRLTLQRRPPSMSGADSLSEPEDSPVRHESASQRTNPNIFGSVKVEKGGLVNERGASEER